MTTTQQAAEQFLAAQGIKFRAVLSERGPCEWNVTFSRKGGGRLKLEFYQDEEPTPKQVLIEMTAEPVKGHGLGSYEDGIEYVHVTRFFTPAEIKQVLELRKDQG